MLFRLDETVLPQLQDITSHQQIQKQYIPSIPSTLMEWQLPSQELSFRLWPPATTLVTLLDHYRCHPRHSSLTPALSSVQNSRQLNMLELGSGTGLVAMAAAAILRAKVTVTDLPHVIPNLHFNVDANAGLFSLEGGTLHVAPLSWREADDVEMVGLEFDVILASDVVYHDHYDPLLETLRLLLKLGDKKQTTSTFVMAHLRRWKESFFSRKQRSRLMLKLYTWIIHVTGRALVWLFII